MANKEEYSILSVYFLIYKKNNINCLVFDMQYFMRILIKRFQFGLTLLNTLPNMFTSVSKMYVIGDSLSLLSRTMVINGHHL